MSFRDLRPSEPDVKLALPTEAKRHVAQPALELLLFIAGAVRARRRRIRYESPVGDKTGSGATTFYQRFKSGARLRVNSPRV